VLKNRVLAIFLTMVSGFVFGQEFSPDSLVRYTGHIFNTTDSSAVPNAHILNLTKGTGTISASDGSFELHVRNLDTLKFSCIGLQVQYYYINTNIQRPDLQIYLNQDTVLMDEVRISPLPLRRFFKYVFLETRVPPPMEPELNLGFMLGNDPGYVPPTGIRFTGPAQALYNTFNKKARLNRKLRNNRKKYSKYLIPAEGDSLVFPEK
jgi:hypothetical protein